MVAILVFQNNETASMLVFQTSPVKELSIFTHVASIDAGHVSDNALFA